MTENEFRLYWRPARNTFGFITEDVERHPSYLLAEAIGVDYPLLGHWQYIELTDELKNILILLRGSHRDTIIKIYQIQKGLK